MKPRPDLLDDQSRDGIEVIQLTDEEVPSSHIYMEAQIFTPDSKRFLLHRSATAHGSDQHDPEHRYLVCDVENDYALMPLTHETGATAPSISPDGSTVYYFVNETETGGGRLSLKRVGIDGTGRDTVLVLDAPLPSTSFRPSRIYPLSTISSDGQRLALSAYLGDGREPGGPYGLMVFDIQAAAVSLVMSGPSWCNIHPQYCRSTDPEAAHDIMVQENHGNRADALGKIQGLTGGAGADIHVIRDNGQQFRNLPWGRNGVEFCQGHQCWIGRSTWAITSTSTKLPDGGHEARLIASPPAPHADHIGLETEGGVRNDLSRTFASPQFHHFSTDIAGRRLVTDYKPDPSSWHVQLADLPDAQSEPASNWQHLVNTRDSLAKESHPHPFLSPDGAMAFFNSDETGTLQAYMIRGLG
jgi:WD40 repeat protein